MSLLVREMRPRRIETEGTFYLLTTTSEQQQTGSRGRRNRESGGQKSSRREPLIAVSRKEALLDREGEGGSAGDIKRLHFFFI